MLKPLDAFEKGMERSLYLVELYELLENRRARRIRSDWADRFKMFMNWNQGDRLVRVDGEDMLLVIRNLQGWDMDHFGHDWLAELLRAALSSAVSSVDRYFHDLITSHLVDLIDRDEKEIPGALARFSLSVADVEATIRKAVETDNEGRRRTRPRTVLKDRFRNALHKETFQGFDQIGTAFAMLGLSKVWKDVAQRLGCETDDVKCKLNKIIVRRNQIVHEGDMLRSSRPREVKLHGIDKGDIRSDIKWMSNMIREVDSIAADRV